MAEEHRSDSINESLRDPVTIGNPCRCKADFSYSITPTKLIIRDTGKGTKSVLDIAAGRSERAHGRHTRIFRQGRRHGIQDLIETFGEYRKSCLPSAKGLRKDAVQR